MEHKIQSLQKLLEKAVNIKNEDSDDSDFIIWRKRVESTLIKLFGDNSVELLAFKELKFYYNPVMFYLEDDHTNEHLQHFRKDFSTAKGLIESYIEVLKDELQLQDLNNPVNTTSTVITKFL
jgi:hypothetical protein